MLYLSLIVSSFLVLAANWFVFGTRHPVSKTIVLCLAVTFVPIFLMFFLPAVAIQALLLVVSVVVWGVWRRGPHFFLRLSGVATLGAYVCAAGLAWQSQHEYARLRVVYPFESMEQRVSAPKPEAR